MKPRKGDKIIDVRGDEDIVKTVSKGVCYLVGSSDVYFVKYLEAVSTGIWKEN